MGGRLAPMGLEWTRLGGSCGEARVDSNGATSLARLSVCMVCFPGNFEWGDGLLAGDQVQVHLRWDGSPSAAKAISAKWASLQSCRASQMALVVKNTTAKAGDVRDVGLIPGLGRSLGGGHSNPLKYSCLKNPMDRGVWRATVHRVTESRAWLKWLGTHSSGLQGKGHRKILMDL